MKTTSQMFGPAVRHSRELAERELNEMRRAAERIDARRNEPLTRGEVIDALRYAADSFTDCDTRRALEHLAEILS